MRLLFTIILSLALAASAFAAEREVTITPLDTPLNTIDQAGSRGVCIYGNDTAAAFAITDWIWGAESYATVFHAAQPECACDVGFNIEQVHFFMNFGEQDVPSTFDLSVDFRETDLDATTGCSVPGAVICASPSYQVTIDTPGLYDIALPLDPNACACANFGYDYAVGINIATTFDAAMRPDAVTDALPLGCVSYNDYGSGWFDTFDFGFPGEVVMFADVVCCEVPVSNEAPSWDYLKSLFR